MKQKRRYRTKPKGGGLVNTWPPDVASPQALSACVHYLGSAEHKARPIDPSFAVSPSLRSDASRCDPKITRAEAEAALQRAVALQCVSQQFENGYPRYAWARLAGQPYVARLINRGQGHYKGWPIEEWELPTDRDGLLRPERW